MKASSLPRTLCSLGQGSPNLQSRRDMPWLSLLLSSCLICLLLQADTSAAVQLKWADEGTSWPTCPVWWAKVPKAYHADQRQPMWNCFHVNWKKIEGHAKGILRPVRLVLRIRLISAHRPTYGHSTICWKTYSGRRSHMSKPMHAHRLGERSSARAEMQHWCRIAAVSSMV